MIQTWQLVFHFPFKLRYNCMFISPKISPVLKGLELLGYSPECFQLLATLLDYRHNGSAGRVCRRLGRHLDPAVVLQRLSPHARVWGVCVSVRSMCARACVWCVCAVCAYAVCECVWDVGCLAHAHLSKCGRVTCPTGLLLYSSKIFIILIDFSQNKKGLVFWYFAF